DVMVLGNALDRWPAKHAHPDGPCDVPLITRHQIHSRRASRSRILDERLSRGRLAASQTPPVKPPLPMDKTVAPTRHRQNRINRTHKAVVDRNTFQRAQKIANARGDRKFVNIVTSGMP